MSSEKVKKLLDSIVLDYNQASDNQEVHPESKEEDIRLTQEEHQEFNVELLRLIPYSSEDRVLQPEHYQMIVQLLKSSKGSPHRTLLLRSIGEEIGKKSLPKDLRLLLQTLEHEEYALVLFGNYGSSLNFIRFMAFLKAKGDEESLATCHTLYACVKKTLTVDIIPIYHKEVEYLVQLLLALHPEDCNDLLQEIDLVKRIKNADDLSSLLKVLDAEGCRRVFAILKKEGIQNLLQYPYRDGNEFLARILVDLNVEQSTAVGLSLQELDLLPAWIKKWGSVEFFFENTVGKYGVKKTPVFWALKDSFSDSIQKMSWKKFVKFVLALKKGEAVEGVREIYHYLKPTLLGLFATRKLKEKNCGSFVRLLEYLIISEADNQELIAEIFDPLFVDCPEPVSVVDFGHYMFCLGYFNKREERIIEILDQSKAQFVQWTKNFMVYLQHIEEEENTPHTLFPLFRSLNKKQASLVFDTIAPVIQEQGSTLSPEGLARLLFDLPTFYRAKAYEIITGKSLGTDQREVEIIDDMRDYESFTITGSSDFYLDTFLSVTQSSADKQKDLGGFIKSFEKAWFHAVLTEGIAAEAKEEAMPHLELKKAFDDLVERANTHRRRPNVFFTYIWGNTKSCNQLIQKLSEIEVDQLEPLNKALGLNLDLYSENCKKETIKQALELYIQNMPSAAVKEEAAPIPMG